MSEVIRSVPGVCEVELLRGSAAEPGATPDVLFEVPHGATLGRHFEELRAQLRGCYPADLQDFFFVNTDVGSPELAAAAAGLVVRNQPRRTCLVVRCVLPRTFVDCNRRIDRGAIPVSTDAGRMTPGLPPWVSDEADKSLLLERYFAYRSVATAAFDAVCSRGGVALCVHTYAPRSVDVPIDDRIVESMHAAYAADRVGSWPLRAAVDLITHDPDGRELASPRLARLAEAELQSAGIEVQRNNAYSLHPVTIAHDFATRYPGQTLCFEVRRDLLVAAFTPFREMIPDPARIARVAEPFAAAVLAALH
jgi:hypothetical protein